MTEKYLERDLEIERDLKTSLEKLMQQLRVACGSEESKFYQEVGKWLADMNIVTGPKDQLKMIDGEGIQVELKFADDAGGMITGKGGQVLNHIIEIALRHSGILDAPRDIVEHKHLSAKPEIIPEIVFYVPPDKARDFIDAVDKITAKLAVAGDLSPQHQIALDCAKDARTIIKGVTRIDPLLHVPDQSDAKPYFALRIHNAPPNCVASVARISQRDPELKYLNSHMRILPGGAVSPRTPNYLLIPALFPTIKRTLDAIGVHTHTIGAAERDSAGR